MNFFLNSLLTNSNKAISDRKNNIPEPMTKKLFKVHFLLQEIKQTEIYEKKYQLISDIWIEIFKNIKATTYIVSRIIYMFFVRKRQKNLVYQVI